LDSQDLEKLGAIFFAYISRTVSSLKQKEIFFYSKIKLSNIHIESISLQQYPLSVFYNIFDPRVTRKRNTTRKEDPMGKDKGNNLIL
jgi:hypothetical protein